MNTQFIQQARQLSVQDQLALMEVLWDDLGKHGRVPGPTPAQAAELDRRMADLDSNPEDVSDWSEVKAAALNRLGG